MGRGAVAEARRLLLLLARGLSEEAEGRVSSDDDGTEETASRLDAQVGDACVWACLCTA